MNKTISISLAGYSFIFEEQACHKLTQYLNALRNTMDPSEAEEVMRDIEYRCVEILRENMGNREVAGTEDVETVIAQIGTPEQIDEEVNTESPAPLRKKTLFRDMERKKIAGVCAGLATYFNLDLTLMRAIWMGILLLGVFSKYMSSGWLVLIYFLLWAILPKAQTASDYLKMRGVPQNFDNLRNEKIRTISAAESYGSTTDWGSIFRSIAGIFFFSISALMILGGLFSTTIVGFIKFEDVISLDSYSQFDGYLITALVFFATCVPSLLFFLIGFKLISPKTKLRNGWIIFGILTGILVVLLAYFGITREQQENLYSGVNEDIENIAINTDKDTLYLDLNKVNIPKNFKSYGTDFSDHKTIYKKDNPDIVIRREEGKTPYLIVRKNAKGYNLPLSVKIPINIENNKILLPNYISYPYNDRLRKYKTEYELVVPNTVVVINNNDKIELSGKANPFAAQDDSDEENDTAEEENYYSKTKMNVNGTRIEILTENGNNTVKINDKTYTEDKAKKVLDSLKKKGLLDSGFPSVSIETDDGKNKVSIKTGK